MVQSCSRQSGDLNVVRGDQAGVQRGDSAIGGGQAVFDLAIAGLVGRPGDGRRGAAGGGAVHGDRRYHGVGDVRAGREGAVGAGRVVAGGVPAEHAEVVQRAAT